jgi:hypothetical protein
MPRERYVALLRLASIGSFIAFTTAFLVTAMSHEGAHALVARLLGLHPVLHHNYVQTPSDVSPNARLWVPAAGPIVSLIMGAACLIWVRATTRPSLITLTAVWLGVLGITTFFGYLVLGPFVRDGDTGKVFAELGTPAPFMWLFAVAGFASMVFIVRGAAPLFARHIPKPGGDIQVSRRELANGLIALPAIAGTALAVVLSLPAPTFASLLYPFTIGLISFAAYRAFVRSSSALPAGIHYTARALVGPLLLLMALIAVSLALIPGVRI